MTAALLLGGGGCRRRPPPFDPTALALASVGQIRNMEAQVPPACYTKTGGTSNPCWVCHTQGVPPNLTDDADLQEEYSFSDAALTNHWANLFVDRSKQIAEISDDDVLVYVRQNNYPPLRQELAAQKAAGRFEGWVPDLDYDQGFDEAGFAKDGSGWRAFRYKPFLGTFWPTNGSTDDVLIRLPERFRVDEQGKSSRTIYEENLAILERAIASPPEHKVALPATYAGGAKGVPVRRYLFPEGTEFFHSVRYLDPEAPGMMAVRMKELRYARKVRELEPSVLVRVHEEEIDKKERGVLSQIPGSPSIGFRSDYGWLLLGFIEDARGRLRVQTEEEHRFCMGCHGNLGVTVDRSFSFARKVPGPDGWRYQDLTGMKDVPQTGHAEPEVLTYFKRVGGGDEFRANDEIRARFFPKGELDEREVKRAAPGGDLDLRHLVLPSRGRALALDKAYLALVREQKFADGRDAVIAPPVNVHRKIENGSTELGAAKLVFADGRLWLSW